MADTHETYAGLDPCLALINNTDLNNFYLYHTKLTFSTKKGQIEIIFVNLTN